MVGTESSEHAVYSTPLAIVQPWSTVFLLLVLCNSTRDMKGRPFVIRHIPVSHNTLTYRGLASLDLSPSHIHGRLQFLSSEVCRTTPSMTSVHRIALSLLSPDCILVSIAWTEIITRRRYTPCETIDRAPNGRQCGMKAAKMCGAAIGRRAKPWTQVKAFIVFRLPYNRLPWRA